MSNTLPGRVVRHTLASCSGSRPHSTARHGGPHFRRRSSGPRGGTQSLCVDEVPGPLSRGWQCSVAPTGLTLASDDVKMANDPVDLWLKPYERQGDTKPAMVE